MRSVLSSVPLTENVKNLSQPSARMRAECRKLLMMTGRMALSSKLPCDPASATAVSLPMTWMAIITNASHCVGLTFPGMIDEPGSLAGSSNSPRPHRGPEASHRMSLAIFISVTARPRSAAWARTIGSSEPTAANLFGEGRCDVDAEALWRVESGADGGAADGEVKQALARVLDVCQTCLELGGVPRPLLADRQRYRILEVGAADLDDLHPFGGLRRDLAAQRGHAGDQRVVDRGDCSNVHRGGEGVVAALAHVHVVVRSHRLLAAQLAAQKLDGAIGQDLVDVHIALGARTGLPDIERELVIKLARYRLVGRLDDRFGTPWLQPPGLFVDHRACLLDQTVGSVYPDGHVVVADREVLQRALRLRAPVLVSGDVDVAEAVEFAS